MNFGFAASRAASRVKLVLSRDILELFPPFAKPGMRVASVMHLVHRPRVWQTWYSVLTTIFQFGSILLNVAIESSHLQHLSWPFATAIYNIKLSSKEESNKPDEQWLHLPLPAMAFWTTTVFLIHSFGTWKFACPFLGECFKSVICITCRGRWLY